MQNAKSAIELQHANAYGATVTVIDWNIGSKCNYACSYCPPALHNGAAPWPSYEVAIAFCQRVIEHYERIGKATFFQFSGGEPTLYKQLPDIATFLRTRRSQVGVISNGSRNLSWWSSFREVVDKVVLTHHIEYVDLDHLIAVARLVSEKVRTHVNITMLPARFDECLANARHLSEACDNISITLKPLLVDFGSSMYQYDEAQTRVLLTQTFPDPMRNFATKSARGLMRMVYDDGSTKLTKASHLIVSGQNRWAGWNCQIGTEILSINQNGQIFRSICRQGGPIGDIADSELSLPDGGILCQKAVCRCVSDITISKSRALPAVPPSGASGST